MKGKTKLLYVLIINIPVAIAIALTAQLLAIGKIIVSLFIINLLIAYGIAFLIGMLIPVEPIGVGFAKLFKVKEGVVFGLLVNLPINFIYVTLISLIMTCFNVVILEKLPIGAFVGGFLGTYPVLYIVGYIVSFIANRPAMKTAQRITN
ncbi:MAG: hypothetical protein ACERKN_02075 [Velocimicrobium sp.]